MGVVRLAAVVLFILAGIGGMGWGVSWDFGTVLGLMAFGLACYALGGVTVPVVPTRG